MFQIVGGAAVGMSTAPETILARRFGLKVVSLSVITNLAAGIEGASPSHEETKREGAKAAEMEACLGMEMVPVAKETVKAMGMAMAVIEFESMTQFSQNTIQTEVCRGSEIYHGKVYRWEFANRDTKTDKR
jgi:hypothetical protein